MKLSLNWVKDWINIDVSAEEVSRALTNAGLEIEGMQRLGQGLEPVLTATILSFEKHPNADRLSVCQVSSGEKKLSLVCGAKNFKAGDRVALALPGVTLPNGLTLKETTIRNVKSHGMLCSEVELGLAESSEGIWILPPEVKEGIPLVKALPIQDVIFEVNITPNRGDCLSVMGLARELACAFGAPLKKRPHVSLSINTSPDTKIEVINLVSRLCPRYTCQIIQGVKIGPSPLWVQRRLQACGIRPINNVVDATNFVMIETGQPLHAFDLKQVRQQQIMIRTALDGESLQTLDGRKQPLQTGDLVIADGKRILALAGIMGGEDSGVTDQTSDLLLESAFFSPTAVRKTSKRLGLQTESSYRFERGVDPNGCLEALNRLAELIVQWSGGNTVGEACDDYVNPILPAQVTFRSKEVHRLLGVEWNEDQYLAKLSMLGISCILQTPGVFTAEIPTFRSDLTREIDLIEEIARTMGYDQIPVRFPKIPLDQLPHRPSAPFKRLASTLKEMGFTEILHFSFSSPELFKKFGDEIPAAMRLKNPISDELSAMRPRLLPQMLETVQKNLFNGAEQLRLFELRPVYVAESNHYRESWHLSLAMVGNRNPSHFAEKPELVSFLDLKGILERLFLNGKNRLQFSPVNCPYFHPKRSARVYWVGNRSESNDLRAGEIGELHPQWQAEWNLPSPVVLAEMDLDLFLTESKIDIQFQEIPAFPRVQRDLNLIVDEAVTQGKVAELIQQEGGLLLRDCRFLDLFRGKPLAEGKKALTYRLEYGAADRTLTDEEVNQARDRLLQTLKAQVGAELR